MESFPPQAVPKLLGPTGDLLWPPGTQQPLVQMIPSLQLFDSQQLSQDQPLQGLSEMFMSYDFMAERMRTGLEEIWRSPETSVRPWE